MGGALISRIVVNGARPSVWAFARSPAQDPHILIIFLARAGSSGATTFGCGSPGTGNGALPGRVSRAPAMPALWPPIVSHTCVATIQQAEGGTSSSWASLFGRPRLTAGSKARRGLPAKRAVEPARSNPEHIVVAAVAATTPAAPSVPPSDLTQIKTWLKYGMTIAQVAQVYNLAIRDLERLL